MSKNIKAKKLILFTGPEGSGKTTLALALSKMIDEGRSRIVRLRGTHTVSYLLMKFIRDIVGLRGDHLHFYNVYIPKKLRRLWITIEVISVIPLILFYYYLLRVRYAVISERSIIDVIVWVLSGIRTSTRVLLSSTLLKFLISLSYKYSDKTFYITASRNILVKRKPNENFLIEAMLPYYNALAKYLQVSTIDTSGMSVEQSLHTIIEKLGIKNG